MGTASIVITIFALALIVAPAIFSASVKVYLEKEAEKTKSAVEREIDYLVDFFTSISSKNLTDSRNFDRMAQKLSFIIMNVESPDALSNMIKRLPKEDNRQGIVIDMFWRACNLLNPDVWVVIYWRAFIQENDNITIWRKIIASLEISLREEVLQKILAKLNYYKDDHMLYSIEYDHANREIFDISSIPKTGEKIFTF